MPDTYFAVACIILFGCLVAAVLTIRNQRDQLHFYRQADERAADEIHRLQLRLNQASRNDHRDARGRFTRAA